MKAWYFSNNEKVLRYGDGRQIRKGVTHKVKGEIELCANGLHASKSVFDALSYAPGEILWRVELGGEIISGSDKMVATERTYIDHIDATELLKEFSRRCALDVIHLWDAPDVVVRCLKTGDESLRAAARAAAWDAAWAAARDAARAAARAAGDAKAAQEIDLHNRLIALAP